MSTSREKKSLLIYAGVLGLGDVNASALIAAEKNNNLREKTYAINDQADLRVIFTPVQLEKNRLTAGPETQGSAGLVKLMYVAYDVTDEKSFERAKHWIIKCQDEDKQVILLAGNSDKVGEQSVDSEEARQFARERNIPYHEVSVKTGKNIHTAFQQGAEEVCNKFYPQLLQKPVPVAAELPEIVRPKDEEKFEPLVEKAEAAAPQRVKGARRAKLKAGIIGIGRNVASFFSVSADGAPHKQNNGDDPLPPAPGGPRQK